MKVLSAHQPNFIPWAPFFEKVKQADIFVVLSGCQFEKNGYQNRFKALGRWWTMPVVRGLEPIREKRYLDPGDGWEDLKYGIEKLKPRWAEEMDGWDRYVSESLVETNSWIIHDICGRLDIDTQLAVDIPTQSTGTDRLVELCRWYRCDTYLSGPSGRNYLDFARFDRHGIRVIYPEESAAVDKPILEVLCDS